ncbi:type I-C CRISPR-associated protein Cas5c [Candidatus Tokpelaia sp.]|uniref:type I-C CRISPR-associated protein Cas5c n=1 Tax=Candidatus Tokpelaia sp. TaxID=2233777 RepID=UPI00123B4B19|nr:type I-C CRISPR-associated protein Cas5c [Candidatus Tokpelaia sp.]KAA6404665.1 type I-C CRISPR-associated protein Cas5 [Candidatus Tokpelaia sp.]
MSYGVRLKVWGEYGCFSRPELKSEPVSYDVMTPSAARGILESIHWKPAIKWVIDAIHVLRPIKFQSIRRNEVGSKISYHNVKSAFKRGDIGGLQLIADEDRQQRTALVLVKPAYIIEAHFELTEKAGAEDNVGKHLDIFNRRAASGQCFAQPCLGLREFPAHFELIGRDRPLPSAIDENPALTEDQRRDLGFGSKRDLGFMLWDIAHQTPGRPSLFFRAELESGIMQVKGKEVRQ